MTKSLKDKKICSSCGHENRINARHCSKCGANIKSKRLAGSTIAILILSFLLFISIVENNSVNNRNLELSKNLKTANEEYLNLNNSLLSAKVDCDKIKSNLDQVTKENNDCKLNYYNFAVDVNKNISDYNSGFNELINLYKSGLCDNKILDLNVERTTSTGFSSYYYLLDYSNCRNDALVYSKILSKSKINDQMALTITKNTKGIVKLSEDQNYTIFLGLYFNDLTIDYVGEIFRFGDDTNYLYLYKDQNHLYFKQSIIDQRIGHIYDLNYNEINYLKIGKYIGDHGVDKNTDIIFIKNFSNSKYNDTIDGIYSRNYGPTSESPGYGKNATIIPDILRKIEFGSNGENSNRIVDLLYLKVYNKDHNDKDLNYFLEN